MIACDCSQAIIDLHKGLDSANTGLVGQLLMALGDGGEDLGPWPFNLRAHGTEPVFQSGLIEKGDGFSHILAVGTRSVVGRDAKPSHQFTNLLLATEVAGALHSPGDSSSDPASRCGIMRSQLRSWLSSTIVSTQQPIDHSSLRRRGSRPRPRR